MDLTDEINSANSAGDLSELEKEVLKFWEAEKIFDKSLKKNRDKKKFTFYDGPPFANGMPHYGHILAMSIKDLFVRYKTMQGYYVPRRNGWDCHGLPVEYQIEKDLKISGKKEIENYGIDKFNAKARESVLKYVDQWTSTIKRIGRWMDFDHTYTTLDPKYIESVWWVFKQLWGKGRVYKDYTSQPYCTRCGTSLSNFETNQGYKDNIEDPSVYIKFRRAGFPNEYFMAWTTTPWTLPANLALAVDENTIYGKYKVGEDEIWVAQELAKQLFDDDSKPIDTKHGRELVGEMYEPLYELSDYKLNKLDGRENAYKIYAANFVTLDEGTGIVHVAPAYGQDDMALGKNNNLPIVFSADHSGKMVTNIGNGKYIKDADGDVINDLKNRKLLWKSGNIHHTYPFCWRCDSPLIYIATTSWFVRVSEIKDQLVDLNAKIKWQPSSIKNGRFGKWLEGARDWNIARSRYWGAPLPIWVCGECGKIKVISSIEELGQGKDFDPHRPQIDKVEFTCECSGKMRRVTEVFDCWFESGSMPYAQWHYPFENKAEFNEDFPADFIAEGLDQTRGWFYTMHVLATAIFSEPAFYNVVVNGMILAEDGQKLSKKLRNYPEPDEIFNELGADALRQYLFSATQIGEDYRFSKRLVTEEARKTIYPLWNCLVFYNKFLQTDDTVVNEQSRALDNWITERLKETVIDITKYLDDYDLTRASRKLKDIISDLSLWYLRLSRKRKDKQFAETLRESLKIIAIIAAPFMPFITEMIYQLVRDKNDPRSVHLAEWPSVNEVDKEIISQMNDVRMLVELGHAARSKAGLKVRQPLIALHYKITSNKNLSHALEQVLMQELNICQIFHKDQKEWTLKEGVNHLITIDIDKTNWQKQEGINQDISIAKDLTPELKQEGDDREIIRTIQDLRKKVGLMPGDKAKIIINNVELSEKSLADIAEQTNSEISVGDTNEFRAEQAIKLWRGSANIYIV